MNVAVLAGFWLLGCGGVNEAGGERAALPDVVLISLDTTRADRLGAYGYDLAHTEHLDALAKRGRKYERAYSPLPLTIPSHGALFTGKYPAEIGIRANGDNPLSSSEHTLAEALSGAGYVTMASVSAFVTTREWGFDQGFDVYFDHLPTGQDLWHAERPAADVVDDVLAWRAEQRFDGPPRFTWLHLYDAHFPYAPPEPWLSDVDQRGYDGELAYIDDQIGRLIEATADRPTIFVVVGDHGEGLGTHTEVSHGLFVYNATQHVPFIISGAGIEASVVDEPVSLVDVAPTLLSILGLPALAEASGRSVPGTPSRPVHMESYQLEQRFGVQAHRGVVSGAWKLIDVHRPELYRQDGSDPLEERNVAQAHPDVVAELLSELQSFAFEPPTSGSTSPNGPGVQQQLEALGYLSGSYLGGTEDALPDPKDRLELVRQVQRLEHLILERKQGEIATLVAALSEAHPNVSEFQTRHAQILAMSGRANEAVSLMERTLTRDPGNPVLMHGLAVALAKGKRYDEAAMHFQEAARRMPYAPRLRVLAVLTLLETDNGAQRATELAQVYVQEHPKDLGVAGVLGVLLVRQGNLRVGMRLLDRAVLAEKPERDVAFHVAAAAAGAGQTRRAQEMLQLELTHHPSNTQATLALVRLLGRDGDWEAQLPLVEPILSASVQGDAPLLVASPTTLADLWHLKAQALFNLQRYEQAREALERGLALRAEHPELLLLHANLLWQEGQQARARDMFEKAKSAKQVAQQEASTTDPFAPTQ